MEHLLRERAQEEQEPLLIRLLQGTTDLLRQVQSAEQSKFKATSTLSMDSALMLKRVQGTLQNNWSSALYTQKPLNKLNNKRWGSNTRQETITVKNRSAEPRTIKTTTNAPLLGEEIRGLDDIFPSQINGFFDESRTASSDSGTKSLPAQKSAEAEQPQPYKRAQIKPIRIPVARTLKEETPIREHAHALVEIPRAELSGSEEIPVSLDFALEISLPEEALPETSFPETSISETILPVLPPQIEAPTKRDLLRERFCTPDNKTVSAKRSSYLRPFHSPDIILANEPAHKRPSDPLKLRTLDLDDDLVADLSSFEHMARNNRILSNSISNLVDQYFHQAALEEEEGYY